MQNVVLLSSSFSGSTLLSMLVCSHPKIIGFGDTYNYQFVDINDTRCTCGASPSNSCPIRVEVEHQMKQLHHNFLWTTSNPTPIFNFLRRNKLAVEISRMAGWLYVYDKIPTSFRKWLFAHFYKENIAFMQALAKAGNYEYYFDGCKSIQRLELLRTVIPNTKVVHLMKNPNAYLHSCIKRGNMNYKRVVDGWFRYNIAARSYREILGQENYLVCTYEDLVKNPGRALAQVYEFIGIPGSDTEIDPCVNKENVHVIGNKMKDSFKKVEDRSPNWQEELEQQQKVYIERRKSEISWLCSIYP